MLKFFVRFFIEEAKIMGWVCAFGIIAMLIGLLMVGTAVVMEGLIKRTKLYKKVHDWLFE